MKTWFGPLYLFLTILAYGGVLWAFQRGDGLAEAWAGLVVVALTVGWVVASLAAGLVSLWYAVRRWRRLGNKQ